MGVLHNKLFVVNSSKGREIYQLCLNQPEEEGMVKVFAGNEPSKLMKKTDGILVDAHRVDVKGVRSDVHGYFVTCIIDGADVRIKVNSDAYDAIKKKLLLKKYYTVVVMNYRQQWELYAY